MFSVILLLNPVLINWFLVDISSRITTSAKQSYELTCNLCAQLCRWLVCPWVFSLITASVFYQRKIDLSQIPNHLVLSKYSNIAKILCITLHLMVKSSSSIHSHFYGL